jgi:hypothetical protein
MVRLDADLGRAPKDILRRIAVAVAAPVDDDLVPVAEQPRRQPEDHRRRATGLGEVIENVPYPQRSSPIGNPDAIATSATIARRARSPSACRVIVGAIRRHPFVDEIVRPPGGTS